MDLVETPAQPTEHRHPWESARAAFFLRVLGEAQLLRPDVSVLDVGAGDAWFATRLADASGSASITCWDSGYEAHPPSLRPHPTIRFVTAPAPSTRFDLALLLDVLEHVEDDDRFLGTIVQDLLKPGARALVSVPAWPSAFSTHDRRMRHHRRYTPSAGRALLERAGLRIERSGGLFHSLLLARFARLACERLGISPEEPANAGEWHHGRALTALASATLVADTAVSRSASRVSLELPGLSWWALCRRPS